MWKNDSRRRDFMNLTWGGVSASRFHREGLPEDLERLVYLECSLEGFSQRVVMESLTRKTSVNVLCFSPHGDERKSGEVEAGHWPIARRWRTMSTRSLDLLSRIAMRGRQVCQKRDKRIVVLIVTEMRR